MGFLNRVLRAGVTTPSTVYNPSAWLIDLLGGPDSATGIKVTEDNALTSSAVWSCVRALSETVGSLPLHVYRMRPDGGRDKVPSYPLYSLLHDQPNPEMTSVEWRETAMGHLLLWGNSYSEIEFDEAFRPIALWPLRPDRMQLWRNQETGALEYIYQLFRGGGNATFSAPEILHIRTLGRDGLLGLSPVGQMREAIGMGLALERFGGSLFGNGAQPGGVLSTDGVLSERAQQNLRDSWEKEHRGPGNAGRIAVLEQGVKWTQTGMPPEDAQFLGSREFSLTEVARIYRMPPHMIQDLTRSTNNNIEQQSLEFVIHTLRPYLVRFEQAFQSRLFPTDLERRRYYALFAVDGLLRGDLASRYAAYAVGRQWGWLSADDIREREDMNPLPNGEGQEYLKPLNMVPAGTVIPIPDPNAPAPSNGGQGGPDGGNNNRAEDPPSAQSARLLRSFLEDVGRRLCAREDADISRSARKYLGTRRPEQFEGWLAGFYAEHRAFIVQQVQPVFGVVDPEFAPELAQEYAERHLHSLQKSIGGYEGLTDIEHRLSSWKAEQPPREAERETRRALRAAMAEVDAGDGALAAMSQALSKLAEPRPPAEVRLENHAPEITVNPAEVRFAEGSIQNHITPSPVTIAEGAVQNHIAPAEVRLEDGAIQTHVAPAEVHFAEGSMQVHAPSEVRIAEGAVRVDVAAPPAEVRVENHPPEVRIEEGAVKVNVEAPPTPPPAEVRVDVAPAEAHFAEGAFQTTVQAPPPAEVTIAEGAVQIAPPPPAEVRIEEGAIQTHVAPADIHVTTPDIHVDVQPPPPAEVTIAEGAVRVENHPPPPAEVRIEEGAVNVTVAPNPPPAVTFQPGSVRVEPPPPPAPKPRPRLARAKAELTERKTAALKRRRAPKTGK